MNHPIALDQHRSAAPGFHASASDSRLDDATGVRKRASGAAPAATAPVPLWRVVARKLWRLGEDIGRARAAHQLRRLAQLHESSDPQLAARLREAALPRAGRDSGAR